MAAPEALRDVCQDDRPALGRDRGLLQAGEQDRLRIRRGHEQQDPRHTAAELRLTRRGVSAPESSHLHAPPDMKLGRNHPLGEEKNLYFHLTSIRQSGYQKH